VLLERFGHKPILVAAFVLLAGSFLFAHFPTFSVALVSLFVGIRMA
jgi:hypothetical protein